MSEETRHRRTAYVALASILVSAAAVALSLRPPPQAQPLLTGQFKSLERRNEFLEAQSRQLREQVDHLERLLGERINAESGTSDLALAARVASLEQRCAAAVVHAGLQPQETENEGVDVAPIFAALAKGRAEGHADGGPVVTKMIGDLQAAVIDGSRSVTDRVLAFRALGRLPDTLGGRSEPVVRSMVELLRGNPEGRRRQDIVTGLRGIDDPMAVEALVETLKNDTSSAIRGEAAQSLATLTHIESVRVALVASAEEDADEDVREEARVALARTRKGG
jgi:HEAT repeat protein